MNTVYPAHQMIQACWRALGQVDPERACAGWGPNAFPTMSGTDASGRTYVVYHWGGNSGAGAVKGRDGFNQIGHLITLGGLVLPNAETQEQLYPVRVTKQEFRCDSAGAGEFRGGSGIEYEVVYPDNAEFSFRAEGVVKPRSFGCNGGTAGAAGHVTINTGQETLQTPTYGLRRYPAGTLTVISPAGGGWGDPLDRDADSVVRDVHDGILSRERAAQEYAVVLDDALVLDTAETTRRRAERRR